jgi:hypothetical protein
LNVSPTFFSFLQTTLALYNVLKATLTSPPTLPVPSAILLVSAAKIPQLYAPRATQALSFLISSASLDNALKDMMTILLLRSACRATLPATSVLQKILLPALNVSLTFFFKTLPALHNVTQGTPTTFPKAPAYLVTTVLLAKTITLPAPRAHLLFIYSLTSAFQPALLNTPLMTPLLPTNVFLVTPRVTRATPTQKHPAPNAFQILLFIIPETASLTLASALPTLFLLTT